MRLRKADLRRRVKGHLVLRYEAKGLTSFTGLEMIGRYFQLDLFDPADGHFEYSAIVTNKALKGRSLWAFLNGRGTHERAYAELKSGFAFDTVPTAHYGANSAWQTLCVLAFNLMNGFQVATGAPRRGRAGKRRSLYRHGCGG